MSKEINRKIHHIITLNELGEKVHFEMPRAAMYFDTWHITDREEKMMERVNEKLAMQYCALADKKDSAFDAKVNLNAKVKYVNRLVNKGVWV